MAAAITTTPIRWCAAATASYLSISMSQAARPRPRLWSMACSSCKRRSGERALSSVDGPMDEACLNKLAAYLADRLGTKLKGSEVALGELTIDAEREAIPEIVTFLRDDPLCLFGCLIDICGVDYPEREERFDVVYHLLS